MDPLLLFLFIFAVISPMGKGEHDPPCFVSPGDQFVEVGSDVEVIYPTSCANGRIFWTVNDKPIKESSSRPLNSTHSILSLWNITARSATIECRSIDTLQIIAGTIITTYTKPRHLSCILHYENYFEVGVRLLLTCSWEHDVPPSVTIKYTLMYNSSNSTLIEICNSQVTNCTVKDFYQSEKIKHYIGDYFSLSVRGQANKWNVFSDSYSFNPYRILKVNPPQFSLSPFADHVLVEWNQTNVSHKHICQVKYRKVSTSENESPQWVYNKTLNPGEEVEIQIKEGLESCFNYRFSVRCAMVEAPWSDWSHERTVLTKLNRKQIRLWLWRKVTKVESNGDRRVRAMWTEIPTTCQGTFTYNLCNENQTSCGNSACEVKLNQDSHQIKLTVFQDQVLIAEDSVYLPAISESVPQVTNISSSTHDGVILVKWSTPVQPVSGYMIDWTHDGNQYHWKETKFTNATLFALLDLVPYNITITPLLGNRTGHGAQSIQICSRVGDPGIVSVTTVQVFDKHVDVSWDIKPHACSGSVINYTVYCWIREGEMFNMTVDGKTQKVSLKALSPETQYRIYVEAKALTGTSRSKERVFITKKFDPDLIRTLTISGCASIVLMFFLGLCCAVQWKKFKEKPVPNPALSSVALWPSLSQQKGICFFQPFSNPSESTCDKIYTEETSLSSSPSMTRSSNLNLTSDEGQDYCDSSLVQDNKPARCPSSVEDCTALTSSEHSLVNPYRSQTSGETLRQKTGKRVKEQEKATLRTVYVTLDMFEHGQDG